MTADHSPQLPPHSIEAEQGVLGCIMLDPGPSLIACLEKLKEGSKEFYDLRHKALYETLMAMQADGDPIDLITVQQRLTDAKMIEGVGGLAYLSGLMDVVPSAANIDYYIETLREKHLLRKMINLCEKAKAAAFAGAESVDDLITRLEAASTALGRDAQDTSKSQTLSGSALGRGFINEVERVFNLQGKLSGIATGFYRYDLMTSGLQAGEMVVVGARPGTGKTGIACNIVENACVHGGIPTAFFSLEMRPEALAKRLCASVHSIDASKLRSGQFNEGDLKKFTTFASTMSKCGLHIVNGIKGMTINQIGAEARKLVRKHGVKLIVVDYLQKVRPSQSKEKRTYEVAEVSEGLKAIADSLNVSVVALAQLNRESDKDKGRMPRIADLADSGQIERDADVIALLHRPKTESDPEGRCAKLIVAKQRDGEVGVVDLHFEPRYCRFTSDSPISAEDIKP